MPPIGGGHGRSSGKLYAALDTFVEQHALGMVTVGEHGFILSLPGQLGESGQPETVLAADVAFVRAANVPARTSAEFDAYWRVAPDLVVEVASPSQYRVADPPSRSEEDRPELAAKARLWLRAGGRLVWVVWPGQRQVDVWRLGSDEAAATLNETDALDGLDVVPGFTLPVARVFA